MRPLSRTFLWAVAAICLIFGESMVLRGMSPAKLWPHALWLLMLMGFLYAFDGYRRRNTSETTGPLTRRERIVLNALGLPLLLIGLSALGLASWLVRDGWIRVARWPRTNATLMSKEISAAGARLVFQYEAGGRRFTGIALRWGSERTVRAALEAYLPGTVQRISYNPKNPGEVETVLSYTWELFRAPFAAAFLGAIFVVGGMVVYPDFTK